MVTPFIWKFENYTLTRWMRGDGNNVYLACKIKQNLESKDRNTSLNKKNKKKKHKNKFYRFRFDQIKHK